MSDVLSSQDFLALNASIKSPTPISPKFQHRGLLQGVRSWEQRVKIDGREQGAMKKSLGAGRRAPRQKGAWSIKIAVTKYKKPINNFSELNSPVPCLLFSQVAPPRVIFLAD